MLHLRWVVGVVVEPDQAVGQSEGADDLGVAGGERDDPAGRHGERVGRRRSRSPAPATKRFALTFLKLLSTWANVQKAGGTLAHVLSSAAARPAELAKRRRARRRSVGP